MLKLVLAMTATMITSAGAADFLRPTLQPSDGDTKALNWTGAYVGIYGTYGWSNIQTSEVNIATRASTFGILQAIGAGGLAGFHAGYMVQSGTGIVGVEADAGAGDLRGTFSLGAGDTIMRRISSLGSARAKIGLLLDERASVFLSGGLAVGNVQLSVVDTLTPARISSVSARVGYTAGFGFSYFLSPRVSVSTEYRYFDLGRKSVSGNIFFDTYRYPTDNKVHTIRVGMNYHLGGISN